MKSSDSSKRNILDIGILGVTISLTLLSGMFFYNMGILFGYKDIDCRQYTETQAFADELTRLLIDLDYAAESVNAFRFNVKSINIEKLYLQNDELGLEIEKNVRIEDWISTLNYSYYHDLYGIGSIDRTEETEIYNDAWYTITLSAGEIKNTTRFAEMEKEDYIRLFMKNASPNIGDVMDDEFSADAYILYYNGIKYVYSPSEDMFYSGIYGWYTIPAKLYFKSSEAEDCTGVDLLSCKFASEEELIKQLAGEGCYTYMQQKKNLEYDKRNIAYYVATGDKLYTNVGNLENLVSCNEYLTITATASGEYAVTCHNFTNEYLSDETVTGIMKGMSDLKPDDTLYIGIYTTFPNYDIFGVENQTFKQYYPYTISALIVMILMAIASGLLLVHIIRFCGGKDAESGIVKLRILDKIPVEIMGFAAAFGVCFLVIRMCREFQNIQNAVSFQLDVPSVLVSFWIGYAFFMVGLLSLVRRGKAGQMFEQSILRWGGHLLRGVVRGISGQKNLTARTVELFIVYWAGMLFSGFWIVFGWESYFVILGFALAILWNIGALVLMIRQAQGEQRIRDLTQILASGNLDVSMPNGKHLATEREILDNINHLSDGLQKAVEKSIYDERMKAELITNVSHDIKTPLTSIISYVDLIKRENVDNENVKHYIEILDRKSQRLKQLTEDLVEVSKLTTGNVELERVPIDFGELLRQTIGEFEDRFSIQKLQVIDSIEEQPYMIFADGRRTFRILENLFQNIYKYAMPETRVYIDMKKEAGMIVLAIKNISKAPLNIDASELMERFVRGDSSRSTEGSGLGLSIAQHLVELQDGEFQIYLDGDLFKIVIKFPEYVCTNTVIEMEEDRVSIEPQEPLLIGNIETAGTAKTAGNMKKAEK